MTFEMIVVICITLIIVVGIVAYSCLTAYRMDIESTYIPRNEVKGMQTQIDKMHEVILEIREKI